MKLITPVRAFIALCIFVTQGIAAPLDFNNDGTSEFVLVSINGDSTLTWRIYQKDGSLLDQVSSFGSNGNHLAPGMWVKNTSLLAALQNNSQKVQWRVRRNAADYAILEVGSSTDTLISGGDFDGDLFTDAASISTKGKSLFWRVHFSPLTKQKSKLDRFGRSTDLPFFMNANGIRDSLALFRNGNTILIRDVQRRTTSIIRLQSTFTSRPFPVKQKNGKDVIVFVTSGTNGSTISAVNLQGKIIKQIETTATGITIVGDFAKSKRGEEIAIQTSTGFQIINPVTGYQESITLPSGIPVDDININAFESAPDACSDETRNPSDGNEGFLWKPASDSTGKLAVHTPKALTGKIAYVEVVSPQNVILERGVYGGNGNGGRDLFRFSKPGRSYPNSSAAVIHLDAGCKITYVIPDTSKRWD